MSVSEAVLEKVLEMLDRVKEVEVENERLRQRVGNLEALKDHPILVPDQDPGDAPETMSAQQHLRVQQEALRQATITAQHSLNQQQAPVFGGLGSSFGGLLGGGGGLQPGRYKMAPPPLPKTTKAQHASFLDKIMGKGK